ncbi:MAG: mechanosensitive ion channel domain-containing protein [Bacteroidota bacterium]
MEELKVEEVFKISDKIWNLVLEYGPKLALAILTLIVGLYIIKHLVKLAGKALKRGEEEDTLSSFIRNLISWVLKLLLFLSVASMVGIETTSFIAIFSAATLAVGFALQGSLSNFAGGVMLLLFRPFDIGHLIEVQGYIGVVKKMHIFNSVLVTPDGKTVYIPNGPIAGSSIVNFTTEGVLRVDIIAGIAYESDLKEAKAVLMDVLENHPLVLKEPAPFVGVNELADSSVNFAVRPWVNSKDYWTVYFDLNETLKTALDAVDISIPYPQMYVHMAK